MIALCIDPGTEKSGIVVFDGKNVSNPNSEMKNEDVLDLGYNTDIVIIEKIVSYGMPVGQSTLDTCVWIGRFVQRFGKEKTKLISRPDVKLHLCNSMRAKDANVRQAVLDKFPATGGGKTPQIGTKKEPGPLYGVSGHTFSALALGITFFETKRCDCEPFQLCKECKK